MLNKAKQKMLEGRPAVGAEVNLGSALSVEIIAPLGFDFVIVDNQHGNWADQTSMLVIYNYKIKTQRGNYFNRQGRPKINFCPNSWSPFQHFLFSFVQHNYPFKNQKFLEIAKVLYLSLPRL
jgi:hypothetical protein